MFAVSVRINSIILSLCENDLISPVSNWLIISILVIFHYPQFTKLIYILVVLNNNVTVETHMQTK